MANILGDDKQQQVLALGRLGWPLRRIEAATGVRHQTASVYLKTEVILSVRLTRRCRPPPVSGVHRLWRPSAGPGPLPPWPNAQAPGELDLGEPAAAADPAELPSEPGSVLGPLTERRAG